MLKIDNTLLQEIGLGGLPEAEKNSLLKHIYETLEMRVGIRLADQMSNQQLDEFEQYFEAKDDAGAFKWLESNFPNYKDIVQEEFDKLKIEVGQAAPQILASAQQAVAQPQVAAPQPQQQYAEPVAPQVQQQPVYAQPAPVAPQQPLSPQQPQQQYAAPPVEQPPVIPQTPPAPQAPIYPEQQPPAGPAQ